MKQQYVKLFSIIFGAAFVVSGVIFGVVTAYKSNRNKMIEENNKIADEIGDVYKTFFKMESDLTAYRDEVMNMKNDYRSAIICERERDMSKSGRRKENSCQKQFLF